MLGITTTTPLPVEGPIAATDAGLIDAFATILVTVQATILVLGFIALFVGFGLYVLKPSGAERAQAILWRVPIMLIGAYGFISVFRAIGYILFNFSRIDRVPTVFFGPAILTFPDLSRFSTFGRGFSVTPTTDTAYNILLNGLFPAAQLTLWAIAVTMLVVGALTYVFGDKKTGRTRFTRGGIAFAGALLVPAILSAISWVIPELGPVQLIGGGPWSDIETAGTFGERNTDLLLALIRATDMILLTLFVSGFIALTDALVRYITRGEIGQYNVPQVVGLLIVLFIPLSILRAIVAIVPSISSLPGTVVTANYSGGGLALVIPFDAAGNLTPRIAPLARTLSNFLSVVQATLLLAGILTAFYTVVVYAFGQDTDALYQRARGVGITLVTVYAYSALFKAIGYGIPGATLDSTSQQLAIISTVTFPVQFLPISPGLGIYTGVGERQSVIDALSNLFLINQLTLFVLACVMLMYGVAQFAIGQQASGEHPSMAIRAAKVALIVFIISPLLEAISWIATGTSVSSSSIDIALAGNEVAVVSLPSIALVGISVNTVLGIGANYDASIQAVERATGISIASVATIAFVGIMFGLLLYSDNFKLSGRNAKLSEYSQHLIWAMGLLLIITFALPPVLATAGWVATGEPTETGQELSGSGTTVETFSTDNHGWKAASGTLTRTEIEGDNKLLIDGVGRKEYTTPELGVNKNGTTTVVVITTNTTAAITIRNNGATYSSQTVDSGQHALPVPDGEHTITVAGTNVAVDDITYRVYL